MNGVTTCKFRRQLNTGDPNDVIINDGNMTIIFALNTVYKPTGVGAALQQHDSTHGSAIVNFLRGGGSIMPTVTPAKVVHGVFMFIAWGVMIPFGAIVARYLPKDKFDEVWFKIHQFNQPIAVGLTLVGFIIALAMVTTQFALAHSYFGLILFILSIGQVVWAFLRPHKEGTSKTTLRNIWELIHKWAGRILPIFGYITIFLGLGAIAAGGGTIALAIIWCILLVAFVVYLELMNRDIAPKIELFDKSSGGTVKQQ